MSKAMIVTVGTGRRGEDIAQAICFSIRQQNPDFILFVETDVSKQRTMQYIYDNPIMKNRKFKEVMLDDVDDVEKIQEECQKYITQIMKKGYKPAEIVAEYTSGTKAMSAGLTLAAVTLKIGGLSYVVGERDQTGRVIPGTERLLSLEPNRIYADSLFKNAVELFNNFRFDACSNLVAQAKKLVAKANFQKKLDVLKKLSNAYSNWDKFNFSESFRLLDDLSKEKLLGEWEIEKSFERHKQILYKEKGKEFCVERMADLLQNSIRRAKEGKYDDAVARLYRLLEYVAQYEINREKLYKRKTNNKPDTSDIDSVQLQSLLLEKYKEYIDPKEKRCELGLVKSFKLLADLSNEIGKNFIDEYKMEKSKLRKVLHMRNNSILAHGFQPISTSDKYNKMLNVTKRFIQKVVPEDLENFLKQFEFSIIKIK